MRGQVDPQSAMFHYFSPESRVPVDHPLRRVKKLAEQALRAILAELDALYSHTGQPSIAPERLVVTEVVRRYFDEMVRLARRQNLLSADHFTVDGTLIDAWASFKSFKRKNGKPPNDGGDGIGMVDFKGEKRSNATHESTTDPETRLMRKGNGQPAKLNYGGHVLMENRKGLCVDLLVTESTQAEHRAARTMLTRARRRRIHPKTVAADKGYHVKDFVSHLREHQIRPHIARIDDRKTPDLDGRTTRTEGYRISQRKRNRVEEIFGWLKTIGGMRKTRFIGQAKTQMAAFISGAAYNLLRIARLSGAGALA